ncbi:MAG: nucleotide sugar dehydrogenase [Planctomycetia bacterium]|nr:nucleotide sugar dehydrogenase [Planctomycetia bacterium]
MGLYEELVSGQTCASVIGLGYVGLPIAISLARTLSVVGYDLNASKISRYCSGQDPTHEVGDAAVAETTAQFTSDATQLQRARFHIVAVPTPVRIDHTPDLSPLEGACRTLGANLTRGSIVVFESTVYPGVTEEVCAPLLEQYSGLKLGVDFKIGYSPERINPGDKQRRLETITKIVSGMDAESLELIARVYELVVRAGVYRAPSIKVAEAAKVIENCQRDVNIAFMNELSIIFNKLGIDTQEVLAAAGTKWNFLRFYPGFVGGHCIGVDPYYLTYKAESVGYHSQVILAGRRINDGMGKYVAENCVKMLIRANKQVKCARVAILGATFKENCPDARNSKVFDAVEELREYGVEPMIYDPIADPQEVERLYGVKLVELKDLTNLDAIIIATAHEVFKAIAREEFEKRYAQGVKTIIDVKGILNRQEYENAGFIYWRL